MDSDAGLCTSQKVPTKVSKPKELSNDLLSVIKEQPQDDKTSLTTTNQGLDLKNKKSDLAFCISPAVLTDESPSIIPAGNSKLLSAHTPLLIRKLSNENQRLMM